MVKLIEDNTEFNYKIFRSSFIEHHHELILEQAYHAHDVFDSLFQGQDSTWSYSKYNVFALTSCSEEFYQIYEDLIESIRGYFGTLPKPMWVQSWMNFHTPEQVLDWHDHHWPFHGYISIDPHDTETVFENYTIKNQIGNIYVGPGYRLHKVNVLSNFDRPRITLGYDIQLQPHPSRGMLSVFPVL